MRRASMAALRPRRGRRRSEQRLTQKLLTAAEEGDSVRVATCLQNGANINSSGVHGTALHYACREGRTEIAKQLIEAHAPLDVMAETDFTPLHVATQGGHVEMVKVLLAAGADPDVPSRFERRSAVILAALDGWEMVLSVLITGGANTVATDLYGSTALHYAAERGRERIATLLVKHGGNPNAINRDGWSPLHLAASCGHVAVAKELIKHSADVNAQNRYGRTPLHWACSRDYIELVQVLLEHGASVGIMDRNMRAPAACTSNRTIRQILDTYAPTTKAKAPTVATTTMTPAKFSYHLTARPSIINNVSPTTETPPAINNHSAKSIFKRTSSSDTDTDTEDGDSGILLLNGLQNTINNEVSMLDLQNSEARYDRFIDNIFEELFPMLDTNVDYLSQTLHGALRTSDHADSTAVVRDAFQRLQQLQTQVKDMRSQLTSGAHFLHRIIVHLVNQELQRRRQLSVTSDSNNNVSDQADCWRRLHYVALGLSRTQDAWQRVLKELFSNRTIVERQTVIDTIAATNAEETSRAYVALCSWWDEKSKNNTTETMMKDLEYALRTCDLDDVIEDMTSTRMIPSISNPHRRFPSAPEADSLFVLDTVDEEEVVSVMSSRSRDSGRSRGSVGSRSSGRSDKARDSEEASMSETSSIQDCHVLQTAEPATA